MPDELLPGSWEPSQLPNAELFASGCALRMKRTQLLRNDMLALCKLLQLQPHPVLLPMESLEGLECLCLGLGLVLEDLHGLGVCS